MGEPEVPAAELREELHHITAARDVVTAGWRFVRIILDNLTVLLATRRTVILGWS